MTRTTFIVTFALLAGACSNKENAVSVQADWRVVRAASLDAPAAVVAPDEPFTLAGNAADAHAA